MRVWSSGTRPRSALVFATCALSFAFAVRDARADEVDIAAQRDNTIYQESASLSNGAGDYLFAGTTDQPSMRRALLRFDIGAQIPSGSTITSATLTLYCSRTKTQNQSVSLYRVSSDWGEGTSNAAQEEGQGASASIGDATWTYRFFNTTSWSTAGGDFAAVASASSIVGGQNTFYTWSSAGMTADVQSWLDTSTTNFGWMIRGNESGQKVVKRFDSRTFTDAAKRPRLHVVFTLPAATPTGACCSTDGTCGVVTHPGGSCTGAYQGSGTSCSPNLCPAPAGACCLPVSTGTCALVTASACTAQGGTFGGPLTSCSSTSCARTLTPFVDALPRPAAAVPKSIGAGGIKAYELSIVELSQKLHSELPATRVWGFSDGTTAGGFPGPTLETEESTPIDVTWRNDLRDAAGALRTTHMLPIDTCLDGAVVGPPRTVMHLHGGHVPAAVDGYPEATFLPGAQVTYRYPNMQDAATLWYHDHALGVTRLNVYMGLAGFYLLRSPSEKALGLPANEFEVPLVIQDRTFRNDGSLVYPDTWMEHFFGDTLLVNGKVWPYLDVKQGNYRFRILNGSNARTYTLALSNGASFQQIGTDGGLLAAPVTLTNLTLVPGERADVIMSFATYPLGTEIILKNSAPAPFPGSPNVGVIADVMKLRVVAGAGYVAAVPSVLQTIAPLSPAQAVTTRDFTLDKSADACTGSRWRINGLDWSVISEKPTLGTSEVWRFINTSGVAHPMHMHLVQFQILDRQAFDLVGGGSTVTPKGSPASPASNEAGWKDTVNVMPNEIVRVIARFEHYAGKYPYHCHLLEHEDNMMMRQFETVPALAPSCGDGIVSPPDETCDPPASCPSSCDDGNPCTIDALEGSAASCNAHCVHTPPTCSGDAGVDVDAGAGVDAGEPTDSGAGGGDAGADAGAKADACCPPGEDAGDDAGEPSEGLPESGCSCREGSRSSSSSSSRVAFAFIAIAMIRRARRHRAPTTRSLDRARTA